MHNTIFIILILALTSCSDRSSNDLESMNLFGNIVSVHEEKRDSSNKLIMTKETCFTNSGMVESVEFYYPQNKVSNKSLNHYDFRNRIIRQDIIMNDSLILTQEYLKINSNKDSLLAYNSNGDLINTAILIYNNDKKVIESYLFDLNKNLIYSEISKYNNDNRLIETKIKSLDPFSNGEVYSYNYDSNGRMQTLTITNPINNSKSVETYSYETDDKKNWIKKITISSAGELTAEVTRKIEYK